MLLLSLLLVLLHFRLPAVEGSSLPFPRWSTSSGIRRTSASRNSLLSAFNSLTGSPGMASRSLIYSSCDNPTDGTEAGICLPASKCAMYSGRVVGSCSVFGSVCCVRTVSKCAEIITLNNTYWQSPSSGIASSYIGSCSMSVQLDQSLTEQRSPICQLRLDIIQLSIAQPTSSICETDTFVVSGGNNQPPVICGDNNGQHMYIHVPSSGVSRSDVKMTFSFLKSTSDLRSWNIKVAMIPCAASYAAPVGCLQYFTQGTGVITSFNWKDSEGATRKLANQAYSICFRSELLDGQRANLICYQPCRVSNAGSVFFITGGSSGTPLTGSADCQTDYMISPGATATFGSTERRSDRACGRTDYSLTVCSSLRPFQVIVKTDGSETALDTDNTGFCGNFMQLVV